MSTFYVKLDGSPAFEASAAGEVPGLKSVQAWFTPKQVQAVMGWLNSHTATHEVNGMRYDEPEVCWVEIPGHYHDATDAYQLYAAGDYSVDDVSSWRENDSGLVHLDGFAWRIASPPPVPPTISDAVHALVSVACLLGESEDWNPASQYLEGIADLLGTVLPHPGGWSTEVGGNYGSAARAVAADFLG